MSQEVARRRRGLALAAILAAAAIVPSALNAQSPEGGGPGEPGRGEQVFARKQCGYCHRPRAQQGVGPPLEELRRPQGAYELAGRLWNHAPAMFTVLSHEGLRWPDIDPAEMADLMAYLKADSSRDAAPDLVRGQLILVSKGCLKCHALHGEGARVAPDLATRHDDYAPAPQWASKMWSHTPRMAATALQRGVVYPRFTDDEMANLIAFLLKSSGIP